MRDIQRHIDPWSGVVIVVTLALFVGALFSKGLGHDLLLEGGVFLVSVKLIMMAYKSSVASAKLNARFDGLENTLARIEDVLASSHQPQLSDRPPNNALQPPGAAGLATDGETEHRARD
jgi:hypothetical protein